LELILEGFNSSVLGPVYTLVAGILTFISPCTLAAIPLIVGQMAHSRETARKRSLILFLTGMVLSLTIAGVIASTVGRWLILSIPWIRWIAAVIFVAIGVSYLDLNIFGWSKTCRVTIPISGSGQAIGGFILGVTYGLTAFPCATPALLAILSIAATTASIFQDAILFLAYSTGQCFLVALAGLTASRFRRFLENQKNMAVLNSFRKVGGSLVFSFGIYLILRPYL